MIALSACFAIQAKGLESSIPAAQTFKILRTRSLGEPMTLDWNKAFSVIDAELIKNLMEGLVSLDHDLKLVPALAKGWTISVDGRTYVFDLRRDVKWSDGTALKAQHFVDGWKRLLSPVTGSSYADLLFEIEGAEYYNKGALTDFSNVGVKAIDDYTLQVKLKSRSDPFIYNLAMWPTYPIRQDLVDRYDASWEKPGNLVTLGAYRLVSHDAGSNIVLSKNPYYYGTTGNIDQVSVEFIPDDAAALQQYNAGKLDLLPRLSSSALNEVRGRADLKSYPAFRTLELSFNTARYPVSMVNVRRAISMGIDRSKFSQFIKEGYPQARSLLPPGFVGGGKDVAPAFDPAQAKKLLEDAGFPTWKAVKLGLGTTDFDYLEALADFLKSQLKKNLGIELAVKAFPVKDYSTMLLGSGQFDLILHDTTAKNGDPDHLMSRYLSAAISGTAWKSADYDNLVFSARALSGPAAREKTYLEALQLILNKDAVTVPLYFGQNWALVRKDLQGVYLNPVRGLKFQEISR